MCPSDRGWHDARGASTDLLILEVAGHIICLAALVGVAGERPGRLLSLQVLAHDSPPVCCLLPRVRSLAPVQRLYASEALVHKAAAAVGFQLALAEKQH